jgi:hypothetical protein
MRARAEAILVAIAAIACADVAAERARQDLDVGHGEGEGISVDVENGAAVVRSVTKSQIVLWGSEPSMTVTIRSPDDRAIELIVLNVLADASADRGVELRPWVRPTHKRALVGVSANTPFRFTIGDDAASREPFRVAMLADVQEAIGSVGEVYTRMKADERIRFVVFNGDQTSRGSKPELDRFEAALEMMAVPFFMTLGNHELGTDDSLYRKQWGRGSHHFTYRGAHFTLLDSASATVDPLVYGWLDGWLAEANDAVHIVSMHIPPFDPVGTRNGAFASRAEAAKLVERLRAGRVDATYYGHVHSYYAYSNGNIPAFISGGGGAIPEKMDGIGRNYLTVDVDPEKQTVETALVRVD